MNQEQTNPSQPSNYKVDALLSGKQPLNSPNSGTFGAITRINADAIADARLGLIEQASLLVRSTQSGFETVQIGSQNEINELIAEGKTPQPVFELTLRDRLLIPALVNAHTHLDLSHIGPVDHDPEHGFVPWVNMIRENRKAEDHEITEAVRIGIQHSLAGGTIAVGDIAGAPGGRLTDAPAIELAQSPLCGVSYLEFFGIGKTATAAMSKIDQYFSQQYPQTLESLHGTQVRIGLQPHAPNTVDLSAYRWATIAARDRDMPMSTHLAETPEERLFISQGIGPQRELLERFGIWDDSVLEHVGMGKHPVDHILTGLSDIDNARPYLVAHVNDATNEAIQQLAQTQTSVAYCPRGSSYFGAQSHFNTHRYRDMLKAGVNVCLGTDSIVNLDTHDRISILDEMRFLHARDATDMSTLLSMATINGAQALGLDPSEFIFEPGQRIKGLIAISLCDHSLSATNSWLRAMQSKQAPEWVIISGK